MLTKTLIILCLALPLAACGGGAGARNEAAGNVSEDPFGATGAPGADMTDNGATDGAAGNVAANAG